MNIKGNNRKTKLIAIISVLSLIVVFLGIAFLPCVKVLSLSNRKNPSEKVYYRSMENGFIISYTHSVNKGRVHDYYKTDGKNFVLYKTEFVSYGAGMPEIEETPGAVFYEADGTYTMEYKRNVGRSFLLSVGVIARHSISINGNEFFLEDFFEPKTSLVFNNKKIPIIEYTISKIEYKKLTTGDLIERQRNFTKE